MGLLRKSKDYVYGIWVYKVQGIWKGYYRVTKSLFSCMKPWTEARNDNKYMKFQTHISWPRTLASFRSKQHLWCNLLSDIDIIPVYITELMSPGYFSELMSTSLWLHKITSQAFIKHSNDLVCPFMVGNRTFCDGRRRAPPPLAGIHDDVIKWIHFSIYWVCVMEFPHIGLRCQALMFSLRCAWTNGWANCRYASD